MSGLTFTPAHRTDYLVTGFFQDEIGLLDHRLSLIMGTKVLRTNFTGVGLEPSVRLAWNFASQHTLWAAYTHALRTPSDAEENFNLSGLVQITSSGTPLFARFNANHDFAPEQLNGYELGYRHLFGDSVYVDATGFYNHYHNLFSQDITGPIVVEDTPPPTHLLLPAQFRNGLLGTTKGIEIASEWRPVSLWRLRGSYSYLHMDIGKAPRSGDVGSGPGIEGSSPRHQVAIQSGFDLSRGVQVDFDYRYVSSLPGQYVSGFPDDYVRAYSTGDARVGWRISPQVELSLAGRNLFQPRHPEFAADPGALVGIRRSAYLRIAWSK